MTAWDRHVRQSKDVADLMMPLVADLDRAFWVVMLNGKNRAIGLNLVSVGALTSALVHPREVMKPAILSNAAAIVSSTTTRAATPLRRRRTWF